MNQYRCETCKNYRLIRGMDECMKADHTPTRQERLFVSQVGCASHSDFQSGREKVLDELFEKYMEKRTTPDYHILLASDFEIMIEELRQEGKDVGSDGII